MMDLATRAGSGVAPLTPDTAFTVLDVNDPRIASTPVVVIVTTLVQFTHTTEDANHEGDYLW